MISHFAAHLIGAVSLPLFVLFGPDALQYRLADSGAKSVVTDRAQYSKIIEIRRSLPELEQVYIHDGEHKDKEGKDDEEQKYEQEYEHEGTLSLWRSLEGKSKSKIEG